MQQIKALGVSQAGLPFVLAPEGMGGALWQRQQKERAPLGFLSHPGRGQKGQYTRTEQQLLAVYTGLLQVEPLMKEQHMVLRTVLPIKGWVWNVLLDPSLPWLEPPL